MRGGISCPRGLVGVGFTPPQPTLAGGQHPGSRLPAVPAGWACLDVVFSATSELSCVIPWPRVVRGMLSVWASSGGQAG